MARPDGVPRFAAASPGNRERMESSHELPGLARGNGSLLDVLQEFRAEGFDREFMVGGGASPTVRCMTCRHEFAAAGARPGRVRRLEGASDPDELLVAVTLRCPNCGARGALVLPYGPGADTADAEVLAALPDPDPQSEVAPD